MHQTAVRRACVPILAALAALVSVVPAASAGTRETERIVRLDAATTPAYGRALVRQAGGRVTRDLHIIHALGARLTAAEARRLAARPGIVAVQRSAPVATSGKGTYPGDTLATAFNQSVKSEKVWNNLAGTGKGVGVAVVDTGISGDHPDFKSPGSSQSRVIVSAVTNPEATTADDTFGHGTHVAGLIAGNSWARGKTHKLYGRYAGSAPDANLISIKASNDAGEASLIDVIYGIQFAVDHRHVYNIRVLNLSLNSMVAESYKTDPLDAAVEAAWFKGLVVVAAAGNRGQSADAVSYAPANDPHIISVGGADDRGTKTVADDRLAEWSSRGRTQDGFAKPDIIAPGSGMVSTLAKGSAFSSMCESCVTDGEYIRAGGTSMSAAVASGVAAVIIQLHPDWTPDQVKDAMVRTYRTVEGMGNEVAADAAAKVEPTTLEPTNSGLTPSPLIDPATGEIDYSRASWKRASWKDATDVLRASWSRASWKCDCSTLSDGSIDPARASWKRASWSTSWKY